MKSKPKTTSPSICIPEGQLQSIVSGCTAHDGIEDGVLLFGGKTALGSITVTLAVPAGPKSIRTSAFFQADPQHAAALDRRLFDRYGWHLIGTAHSHHTLGVGGHASRGDQLSVAKLARNNDLMCWVQLIITQQRPAAPDPSGGGESEYGEWEYYVHAYHYSCPRRAKHARWPIRVLPGHGPYAAVLLAGGEMDSAELLGTARRVPLSRISYDGKPRALDPQTELPDWLRQELVELAEEQGRPVPVEVRPEEFVIQLGRAGQVADVIIPARLPHAHRRVLAGISANTSFGTSASKAEDVTDAIKQLDPLLRLKSIAKWARDLGSTASSRTEVHLIKPSAPFLSMEEP